MKTAKKEGKRGGKKMKKEKTPNDIHTDKSLKRITKTVWLNIRPRSQTIHIPPPLCTPPTAP
ncbi:predicted protein [Plenodomus lingam JN3]|uniref:Predicted protein n=1 Tax=Leptosphaeria maculans (strain JN3 / isolate v23.1.3 / race Av1-4-5-6-7-8) TaxID=985895 RepID=E5ABR9_LEPMJ|nr:predicted protein [Plenodomus lingam JN3]CBY01110.1 predicted protein [Plenodomus lingam JN3]